MRSRGPSSSRTTTPVQSRQTGRSGALCARFVRENVQPSTDHGGHDNQTHGLRYLEWTWDPDLADTTYVVDYAYLVRTPDGGVRVEHDRHIEGLFTRADWLRLLSDAGFDPRVVPFEHSELEPRSHEVFVPASRGDDRSS